MSKNIRRILIYTASLFVFVMLIQACANISSPIGGKKDIRKPVLLNTIPKQHQTNFIGKRIILNFNEAMNIAGLKDKMIINPIINQEYEIQTNKKSIIIEYKKTIGTTEETRNKTITIDFQNGLKDATEGNTIDSYRLVFSTAEKIDSGSISGLLLDSYNQDSVSNAIVGLYKYSDTMNIQTNKPTYFTTTNKGQYKMENIAIGEYKLFAFLDKNKNSIINIKNEKIAFFSSNIIIQDTINNVKDLQLSTNDLYKTNILSIKNETEIKLVLDEAIYQYQIDDKTLYHLLSPNRKEIIIYKTDLCEDTTNIQVAISDSSFNDTTIVAKIVQSSPKKFNQYKNIIASVEPYNESIFIDSITLKIVFFEPVINEKKNSIVLIIDSISNQNISLLKDFKSNTANTEFEYRFKPKFKPNRFVQLYIYPNKFKNYIGDTNISYMNTYRPTKPQVIDDDGSATITINTKAKDFIVELLKDNNDIIDRKFNLIKIKYPNLPPGKYSLRLIEDVNKNKRWDSGNYKQLRQPEKVTFYRQIIDVKKNWEIEDLTIEF